LGGEDGSFVVIQEGEEWDLSQDFGIAGHGSSGIESLNHRVIESLKGCGFKAAGRLLGTG
jgi:hypothetical protein